MSYIQTDEPYPNPILDLSQLSKTYESDLEFPACCLVNILFQFVSFRAAIKRKEIEDPEEILQGALVIDHDLEKWHTTLPPTWKFETIISTDKSDPITGGKSHFYWDIFISRAWSHYRWIRILLQDLMLKYLDGVPISSIIDTREQRLRSIAIIRQTSSDIGVSVSFHLCHFNTQLEPSLPRPEIIGAFDLVWPLKVVANSIYVSDEMHAWTVRVLQAIGNRMGIRQAQVWASEVQARRRFHQKRLGGHNDV